MVELYRLKRREGIGSVLDLSQMLPEWATLAVPIGKYVEVGAV